MAAAHNAFDWDDNTVLKLRQLWDEGHSTSEIGRRLGVSKNAAVGKAHRLGLPARPTPIRTHDPSAPRPKRPPPHTTVPKLQNLVTLVSAPATKPPPAEPRAPREPLARRVSAIIGDKPCCWPIGEPGTRGFRYCDCPALVGKPYCPEHAELAYVKPRDRRSADQDGHLSTA